MQLRGPVRSSVCGSVFEHFGSGSCFDPNNPFKPLLIDTFMVPIRKQLSNDAIIDLTFGIVAAVVLWGGAR